MSDFQLALLFPYIPYLGLLIAFAFADLILGDDGDDDDDDKYGGTKITTPGSYGGYSGVPGGRATGGAIMKRNKKQTIQMEKVKI